MSKPVFITVDFNLPNHSGSLTEAEHMINDVKKDFQKLKTNGLFDDKSHEDLYDRIALVLDWIGRMSDSVFAVRDDLEQQYEKLYYKSPKLARKLFEDHYSKLHRPYSTLKNRCFGVFEELDDYYIQKFKRKPSNWEL